MSEKHFLYAYGETCAFRVFCTSTPMTYPWYRALVEEECNEAELPPLEAVKKDSLVSERSSLEAMSRGSAATEPALLWLASVESASESEESGVDVTSSSELETSLSADRVVGCGAAPGAGSAGMDSETLMTILVIVLVVLVFLFYVVGYVVDRLQTIIGVKTVRG
jgi:hypothetical protein